MNYLQHMTLEALVEQTPKDQRIHYTFLPMHYSQPMGPADTADIMNIHRIILVVTSFHENQRLCNYYEELTYEAEVDVFDEKQADKNTADMLQEATLIVQEEGGFHLTEGRIRV